MSLTTLLKSSSSAGENFEDILDLGSCVGALVDQPTPEDRAVLHPRLG